jgi:hypothetical protein
MKAGILAVAAGSALMVLSLLFSSGYYPRRGVLGNLHTMEIAIVDGLYVPGEGPGLLSPGRYEGRVAIPTRWPVAVSSLVIIGGLALISVDLTSRRSTPNSRLQPPNTAGSVADDTSRGGQGDARG